MKRLKTFPKKKQWFTVDDLVREAEEWDRRYLDVVVHSLAVYDAEDQDDLIREFLSKRYRGNFKLTNPHSKKLWLPALLQSFLGKWANLYGCNWEEDLRESKIVCGLVTFTHDDWASADSNIQFDLRRAKQKVRNALSGTDFIASFDAAVYANESWQTNGEDGKLVSFHCHAIVWIGSQSGLDRLRRRIQRQFRPILGNKSGVHVRRIKDETGLARSTRYLAKMPLLGYRTLRRRNGKKIQTHSKITFSSRRNLFHALKNYSTFDFWLAGGEGVPVLRGPRNDLKRKYEFSVSKRLPRYRY